MNYYQGGRFVQVERIEPSEGDHTAEERTVDFELTVEGEPPEGAAFFGFAGCCGGGGGPGVDPRLTDPDGDGVYTGSGTYQVTVNPHGTVQPLPAAIFGGIGTDAAAATQLDLFPGEDGLDIVAFGDTVLEYGQPLTATYSFESGEGTPEGSSTEDGGAEGGAATAAVEETTAADAQHAGSSGGEEQGGVFEEGGALSFLPDTGGAVILVLGIGLLLAAGGLVAYRVTR